MHAYAEESLTANANKSVYFPNDKVVISGYVKHPSGNSPVTIIIRNPIGNVYEVGQSVLLDNSFAHDFVIGDDSLRGKYNVDIRYGVQETKLTFVLVSGVLNIIPINDSSIVVRTNDTNPISYGSATVSFAEGLIKIPIDTSKSTTSLISQEYQIPKKILDTSGIQITIRVDGNDVKCSQSVTNVSHILDCTIPHGAKELELLGTSVIPEFGMIVYFMIGISMMFGFILSRFYNLSKYKK